MLIDTCGLRFAAVGYTGLPAFSEKFMLACSRAYITNCKKMEIKVQ